MNESNFDPKSKLGEDMICVDAPPKTSNKISIADLIISLLKLSFLILEARKFL